VTHTAGRGSRRLRGLAWVGWLAVAVVAAEAAAAAQLGIFKRNKGTTYQAFRDPGGRFVIEYPVKDWRVNPAKEPIVASFAHKSGDASVVVDHSKLKLALTNDEIDDVVIKLEVDALKEREPSARDINASLTRPPAGPRIVIRYTREPAKGAREQVEQYSIASGDDLYHVVCAVKQSEQTRLQPILSYIAGSFSLLRTQS